MRKDRNGKRGESATGGNDKGVERSPVDCPIFGVLLCLGIGWGWGPDLKSDARALNRLEVGGKELLDDLVAGDTRPGSSGTHVVMSCDVRGSAVGEVVVLTWAERPDVKSC
jgi:hypothetical protein